MKVRIKVRPSGLLNGADWPDVGEVIELPDSVAKGMIEAGSAEKDDDKKSSGKAKENAEKRPAGREGLEERKSDGGAS
jgi:hypothetical protein